MGRKAVSRRTADALEHTFDDQSPKIS
jgi:hypothetical protein